MAALVFDVALICLPLLSSGEASSYVELNGRVERVFLALESETSASVDV